MSFPWIKVNNDIPDHPKSFALTAALNTPRAWTFMVQLWLWASRVKPYGDLAGIPDFVIAEQAGWKGDPAVFVNAMITVGFMTAERELNDWEEHQGAIRDKAISDREKAGARREAKKEKKPSSVKSPGTGPGTSPETRPGTSPGREERRGEEKREDTPSECVSAPAPPPPLPPPAPIAEEEPEPDPIPSTEQRLERRESHAVVRSGLRREFAEKNAAAAAIIGRPQTVKALLAEEVVENDDGCLQLVPIGQKGRTLREVWGERYQALDGKGDPRRPSLAEVLERVWRASLNKVWRVDAVEYLSWWSGILATEAGKVRFAWDRDGGVAGVGDPDRSRARRRYHELQGLNRDLAPFETWFVEQWKTGNAEAPTSSSAPGSGARPVGPRSGASPVRAADVMRETNEAIENRDDGAALTGFAAIRAAVNKPRTRDQEGDDVDLTGVRS